MDLRHELSYDAAPDAVFAMLTDEAYLRHRLERTGGREIEVEVTPAADGGAVVRTRRSLPAAVPGFAQKFIGDSVRIDQTDTWHGPDASGVRVGEFRADFGGAPASLSGTMRLEPTGTGARQVVEGVVKASVPFVGGKIEALVHEQVLRALRKEETLAREWLAGS